MLLAKYASLNLKVYHYQRELLWLEEYCLNVSATPIGQMGLKMGWFPLGNGVCLIMKKAPSDSPIWQLKKRELFLPLSFLITKPIKLDLSNLHYGPHYEPHYRTQGCVIRENNITAPIMNLIKDPIKDTLVPLPTKSLLLSLRTRHFKDKTEGRKFRIKLWRPKPKAK